MSFLIGSTLCLFPRPFQSAKMAKHMYEGRMALVLCCMIHEVPMYLRPEATSMEEVEKEKDSHSSGLVGHSDLKLHSVT